MLLALPSLREHQESSLIQTKVSVQRDAGCSWWMAKCFLWLPTAPACTAFHPAFGMLVDGEGGLFLTLVLLWQALWVQQGFPGL